MICDMKHALALSRHCRFNCPSVSVTVNNQTKIGCMLCKCLARWIAICANERNYIPIIDIKHIHNLLQNTKR